MTALALDPMATRAKRYYPLRTHPTQLAYSTSPHRFNVVPAGRRSGKTERFKRKLVQRALDVGTLRHDETPRFFAGAPTRDQAKRIFWADLKAMTKPFCRLLRFKRFTDNLQALNRGETLGQGDATAVVEVLLRILSALTQPGANNDMVAWLQAIEANTRRTVAGPSVASVQARAAEFA